MTKTALLTFAVRLIAVLILPISAAVASSALNTAAQRKAHDIAQARAWVTPRALERSAHPLGIQTLSIEKQEDKATPDTPLIRVYQFHYPLQQARLVVVNPTLSYVLHTKALNTVHLPLNQAETTYAHHLLEKKTALLARLRDEQLRRGHESFKLLADLDVKASIYEPTDINHACHRQRCALMSLFDDTKTVFSIEPIVNLQTLQVSLLNTP